MGVAIFGVNETFAQNTTATTRPTFRSPTRTPGIRRHGLRPPGMRPTTTAPTMPAAQTNLPAPNIEQLRKILRSQKSLTPPAQANSAQPVSLPAPVAVSPTPVAIPTTLPAGVKGIQFSFTNAPYSSIFDFIERITGLPILGDRNIPGNLTYFNRKKMTTNEAIEELNILLKEKGVVLIRTDGHLQIGKFPDVLRASVTDFITTESFLSSDTPPNQVVRVFFSVGNLSAEELTNLLAEALPVNEVKLAAWKTPNQMQIVALASMARKVITLAKKLDSELKINDVGLAVKIFKPKFIQPSALDRIVRSVIPPGGGGGGVVGPGNMQLGQPGMRGSPNFVRTSGGGAGDNFQMFSDDMTGTLVVRGSSGTIDQISKLVDMLDKQEDVGNITAERVPIQYGSIQVMTQLLNESVKQRAQGVTGGRNAQPLSIQGDEASKSIILAGSRTLVDQAEKLIKTLDQPTVTSRVRVIPMVNARVDTIFQSILIPFFQQKGGRPLPAAPDTLSNSVITWASGNELEDLKSLLQQLDESAKSGNGLPTIKTYRLEDIDVNRIVASLQAIFPRQPDITFAADPASKTLIVAAPPDKFERIEKIINDLKSGVTDRNSTQIVAVKYANVDQLAAAVNGTFANRRMPTGEPRIQISTNAQANSILVTGGKPAVDEAIRLIGELDEKIHSSNEIKIFKLNFAQSDDALKTINDLYAAKDPTLRVVSDPWSNTLFISGGASYIEAISQLIKNMDHAAPAELGSTNVVFITLKTAVASEVADQIDSMMSVTGGKNVPTIQPSDTGNYLIVTGQPKQIERVKQLAEQIDTMARQVPEIIAIRPIYKVSAERLSQMLSVIVPQISGTKVKLLDVNLSNTKQGLETFMEQGTRTSGSLTSSQPANSTVTIGVDKINNTLIIRGKPKEIDEIDKSITTLTTDMREDVQFKIYALKFASPSDVALELEALFNEAAPGQPQPAPQPQAQPAGQPQPPGSPSAARPRTGRTQQSPAAVAVRRIRALPVAQINSVVVRAEPRDFQTIEQFISEMDQPETGNIKIYKLNYARADIVAQMITDLFRGGGRGRRNAQPQPGQLILGGTPAELSVSSDLTTNSLIVKGSKLQVQDIEAVIAAVDKPEGAGVGVHLLTLKTAKADQVAPMIQTVMQQAENSLAQQRKVPAQNVAITFDKYTNSLIVAGTTTQFEQVKTLVERLEAVRPSGERRMFIVPLKNLDPEQAKKILEQLLPAGRSSRSLPINYLPNLSDEANLLICNLTLALSSTRNPPTSQPMPLKLLRQMLKPSPKENRPVLGPEKTTTTAPAPQEEFKRFPKTIVQKGPVLASPEATLSTTATKELQTLAGQIKGNVEITTIPDQNALIINASPEDYELIQQLLNLIQTTTPKPEVKIFSLKNARASDLADVVGKIFSNRPLPKGYPPVTLTPDLVTNSIIVSAPSDVMSEISPMIAQLDAQEKAPPTEFKIRPLKNARAVQIVPQIQEMLKQITQARGLTKTPYTVMSDDRTNTIMVTAPKTYMDQIEQLITTLDTVPFFATSEMEIVRLKKADADALGKILTDLTVQKPTQGGAGTEMLNRLKVVMEHAGEKGTLDLEKPIKIIPDKPSQSILILSTPDNNRILRHIATILDTVPLAEDVRVRVYPLKSADAQEIQKTLADIFSKGEKLTKVPGTAHNEGVPTNTTGQALVYSVSIAADKASNTVIASGQETSLALIEVLIGQLDQQQSGILYPIRTIGLKNGVAKDLSKLIQEMTDARTSRVKDLGDDRAAKRGKSVILADERMNALLVSAGPEDFDMIVALVKKLDYAPTPGSEPVLIHLINIDATTAGEMLDKFFKERTQVKLPPTQTQPGFPPSVPVIIPEPRSNTLIVSAGTSTLKEIRMIVKKLDTMTITKKMQIAVVPLKSADAGELATAIMQVMNPTKDQAGLKQAVILEFIRHTPEGQTLFQRALKDQVFIYGEKATNLLIAVAPQDTIELIRSLAENIDAQAPSLEIKAFALINADATQMKKTIEELLTGKGGKGGGGGGGTTSAPSLSLAGEAGGEATAGQRENLAVTADTRTNSLLVSATPGYMKLAEKVIRQLDAAAVKQLQTEVITLKNGDADTIQTAVTTLFKNQLELLQTAYGKEGIAPERLMEQQVNIVADNTTRKLILQASPRYFTTVRKIIDELDIAPSQVLIQAMIIEISLTGRIEYGFEAVSQDMAFTKNQTAPGIGPGRDIVIGTDVGAAGSGAGGVVFSIHSEDFNLLLRALNTDGKTTVISRPQILARDNTESTLQIGQSVPVPTGTVSSGITGNLSTSISYQKVGVILKVTPHINSEGYINLKVAPEVSSISNSSVQIAQGLNATIINEDKLETNVTIKDGETVVIGGLITKRRSHSETKVPFLGDIPFIGHAFKSVSDEDTRSELLIVLTPKIADSVEKARSLSEEERDMMQLLPREVRESQLMGKLRQVYDEEGIPTSLPATQPGQEDEYNEIQKGVPLFGKPKCYDQLWKSLQRTCDQ